MIPALGQKPADIRFRKGQSDVHYDLLSSGEKEVFNILFNLFTRREHFPNAIYFIDELDVHLHTRLQHALIREVVEHWIPDYSQLWTASHSLGFIEYAGDAADAAIIDFDDLDFDRPQVLAPAPKSPAIFDIAVPRDSALKVFPNQKLVVCENQGRAALQRDRAPRPVVRRRQGQERRRAADQRRTTSSVACWTGTSSVRTKSRNCAASSRTSSCSGYYSLESYLLPSAEPGGGVAARIRRNGISGFAPGKRMVRKFVTAC